MIVNGMPQGGNRGLHPFFYDAAAAGFGGWGGKGRTSTRCRLACPLRILLDATTDAPQDGANTRGDIHIFRRPSFIDVNIDRL